MVEIKADNTKQLVCFAGAKIHTICRKRFLDFGVDVIFCYFAE